MLHTAGAEVVSIEMGLRQRILSAIAHPNIAYLLLSLGMLGLTVELWSPGAVVPGVVGAVSLLLAFFSLQLLPVNYAGLLLILLGMVLLVLEIKVTSYGLLTVGGAASLIFGSMILVDSSAPELQLDLRLILPVVGAIRGDRRTAGAARGVVAPPTRRDRRSGHDRPKRPELDRPRARRAGPDRHTRRDLAGGLRRVHPHRHARPHRLGRRADAVGPQGMRAHA